MPETGTMASRVAKRIRVPLWTVDADVIVPSRLLLKEQFAARTIRPRIHALLPEFMVRSEGSRQARAGWKSYARLRSLPPNADSCCDGKMADTAAPVLGLASGRR